MTGVVDLDIVALSLTWLLTYWLHSTVLLVVVWIAARLSGDMFLAFAEVLWKTALLAGIVTATVQVGIGLQAAAGTETVHDETRAAGFVPGVSRSALGPFVSSSGTAAFADISAAGHQVGDVSTADADRGNASLEWTVPRPVAVCLLSFWIVGAAVGLARLLRSRWRLTRLLRSGRWLPPGRIVRRLEYSLGLPGQVRVGVSSAVAVPFAAGTLRPSICLPEFAIRTLTAREFENLLAHELAHLARRDPLWIVICRIVESVFFFQPLNGFARRRIEAIAECLCDDRAVKATGRPLDLARCLVEIARTRPTRSPELAAAAISSGTHLARRVNRLLKSPQGRFSCSPLTIFVVVGAVLASAAFLPAVVAPVDAVQAAPAEAAHEPPHAQQPPEEPAPAAAPMPESEPKPAAAPSARALEEPPKPPSPASPPEYDSPESEERAQNRARLEAQVHAEVREREAARSRQKVSVKAATQAASEAIERHLASLEAEMVSIEEAKAAIQQEMMQLQQQISELQMERFRSQEEIEAMRLEALQLAQESRPSEEELDRLRAEMFERQHELDEQIKEEVRRMAAEKARQEIEAAREAESEAQRRAELERQRALELNRQREELERQERERASERGDG